MIPRFKPFIDFKEYQVLLTHYPDPVKIFENEFARHFSTRHALSFMYGRSAIWAILNAYGIHNANVIIPAYTCKVVAEAVVKSKNIPLFIDINASDFNMDLEQLENTIDENTRAVIATHLFGHPMNIDKVEDIINSAQNKFGHPILLIQDCAHAFGTEWNGKLVANCGDAAIYGFSLSKTMTTMLGGMLTTSDDSLYEILFAYRNENFHRHPGILHRVRPLAYLMASSVFFHEGFFNLVNTAENVIDHFRKDEQQTIATDILLPPAFYHQMYSAPAKIGMVQLQKFDTIFQRRRLISQFYRDRLFDSTERHLSLLPPDIPGSSYSYFVVRIPERKKVIHLAQKFDVQLGSPLPYCLANLPSYQKYHKPGQRFENAEKCSLETVNLPNYPGISQSQQEQVINAFNNAISHLD